jgi:aminomethyltransferase
MMNRTVLSDWHTARGGRMVDFSGWEMPIQYTSIIEEHHAVRRAAGLFDVSHMGRLKFTGPQACAFLDRLLTNDVSQLEVGQIRYSLVCNESGGTLDDVLVYRFDDCYRLVVNASNREKIIDWIDGHRAGFDVTMTDETFDTCMIAVQGPRALQILQPLTDDDLASLPYYMLIETSVNGEPAVVSRTGYTGEDGFEVTVSAPAGRPLWESLLAAGAESGVLPCGLGARDTLRLEAAMPLYGHELDESTDPLTAGLAFAVKLKAGDFIGKDALLAIKTSPPSRRRIGLVLEGRRIAREGSPVYDGEDQVGRVTSGTFSPTLEKSIAMAYVAADLAAPEARVEVDLRGKRVPAVVTALPFYKC